MSRFFMVQCVDSHTIVTFSLHIWIQNKF